MSNKIFHLLFLARTRSSYHEEFRIRNLEEKKKQITRFRTIIELASALAENRTASRAVPRFVPEEHVTDDISGKWALILGASGGFGGAACLALARRGFNIAGVHLDRRATLPNAERIAGEIRGMGRQCLFFNVNAADPERRSEVIRGCKGGIDLMLHSLAFGTLKPYIAPDPGNAIKPADMNMTLDVMAHSLVYWTQDLFSAGMLKKGARILAMTSAGGRRVWPAYGAVSAAKSALEAHVRQLAFELAAFGISVNALQAGVTDTPAARRIPGAEQMFARAIEYNPGKRLTTPEDVAEFIAAFASCGSNWATGNVIRIDGGEDLV